MSNLVTLRKAAHLRSQLAERIALLKGDLSRGTMLVINVFDPQPLEGIKTHEEKLRRSYANCARLANTLYALRNLIDHANHKSGVSGLLTEIARINYLRDMAKTMLIQDTPRLLETQIAARVKGTKDMGASSAYFNADLTFPALSAEFLSELKKEDQAAALVLSSTMDDLEHLNITTTIEIPEGLVYILREEGLM
jgi:hypothetical protein